jgi:hypothetical protein
MRRWWILLGSLLITVALSTWVAQVALLDSDERSNAAGYGQFVLAAVGILVIVAQFVKQALTPAAAPNLDEQADLLAANMRTQWTKAATDRRLIDPVPLPIRWRRSSLPVAGPISAAVQRRPGQAQLDPLPGLAQVTAAQLEKGDQTGLHTIYGGLGSGRLIIVGTAGSGKSAAAILLLLEALNFRERASTEDRMRIPVPVMFTLHGWNPATTSSRDWIISKLAQVPQFGGKDGKNRATRLLDAGRIAVFLDGLDEIAASARTAALEMLSEQATFRLVLLTRSSELVETAQHSLLTGAVALELQPIPSDEAATYLLSQLRDPPPAGWKAVTDELVHAGSSPLVSALSNPLIVTLLRDAYPPNGPVSELLDATKFPTPDAIENHLLDYVLIAAYTRWRGRHRYSPLTAHRTLSYIASQLNRAGTRDLAWWDMSTWSPRSSLIIASGLTTGFVTGLTAGFASWLLGVSASDYSIGLGFLSLLVGCVAAFVGVKPREISSDDPRSSWRKGLAPLALFGLLFGLTSPIASWLFGSEELKLALVNSVAYPVIFLAAWPQLSCQAYLFVRRPMPLRLMRFLEDARSRQVLRTVGPIYQFRHAKLQDRLAGHGPISMTVAIPAREHRPIIRWHDVSPWIYGAWQVFVLTGLWRNSVDFEGTRNDFASDVEAIRTFWAIFALGVINAIGAAVGYKNSKPIRNTAQYGDRGLFYLLWILANILALILMVALNFDLLY